MATQLEKFNDDSIERTKAEQIVFGILDEMSNRRGVLDMDQFDEDIQEEMLEAWVSIADNKLSE